ncbi:colanic acid biosynthesis, glycosyl transferase [Cupriavidus taiwanensis]|uniref:glycosyltransferase WbuB n=1 Tax=Cupriavidus taiwanensis TaxID=164546 RepID=UPI000E144527|nr:glycosyltransferase WbuB [Cupriavidus taiwanensis]SOZ17549.1 colanic acid biosynthesis, glycosyl transferase [Cupriavidus taiwanensis]SOZ29913.1 colanic acid biosynthesis, glycosyl transferase [Cupriavidus taiwanensis]SOZ46995.1 colanic acid biosynthesis, glycosyl transferase [Cupriavidus taiwanensis]SPA18883.1 colanic acid biosynthesis, glycosyl transferase [Cupriavidus taiwanensis]
MKILIYCQNYAPELTGIGKYTGEQAQWLAARGHEVRVICAPPYYPAWRVSDGYSAWRYASETHGGVTVYRAPVWVPRKPSGLLRILHLMSFALSSLPCMAAQLRWRPDVIFAVEPTLMCSPAALLLGSCTRARTWLHVQDLEVDAAFALGVLRHPLLRRLATRVERALTTRYQRVSTISQAMADALRAKGVSPARLKLLPNWADLHEAPADAALAFRHGLGIAADAVIALYAGNMGNKQGLEVLADAAQALQGHPRIHLVLCGDGSGRAALQARCAGLARVHFLPLQPQAQFHAMMAAADMHLLPQRADAADLVMPSKLTGMLASRRAVIATAQPDTELGRLVARVGVLVPPGDASALAHAIATLACQPQRRAMHAAAGRAWAEAHLGRDAVLAQLESSLQALVSAPAAQDASAVA